MTLTEADCCDEWQILEGGAQVYCFGVPLNWALSESCINNSEKDTDRTRRNTDGCMATHQCHLPTACSHAPGAVPLVATKRGSVNNISC